MADTPLPRPRQVTFSGWTIVVGSVLTVVFAFQRVAALGSLESQEAAADFISTPPGEGLGLAVDDVQLAIRIMCLVAGGTAAATAILGWYVMQPSRSARIVLSVLAPFLFVAGLTSGGLLSALVAVGVAMLWVQPARDWFNGKAPEREPSRAHAMAGGTPYAGSMSQASPPPPPSDPGRPAEGSWTAPHPEQPTPNPYGAPPPPPGGGTPGVRGPRPGRVTAAGITTIVASAVTFAGLVVSILYIATNRAAFQDQIDDELAGNSAYADISSATIADVSIGFLAVLAVWCLAAVGLAIGTLRGSNGARITLVVSASLSALVSLVGALVIVPLLLTIASITTVVLLLTGGVGEWFAARKG